MPTRLPADDEEEEAYMEPGRANDGSPGAGTSGQDAAERAVLVSRVDPLLWKIELERVAPKLRITLAADAKDWRSHLDEAHAHREVRPLLHLPHCRATGNANGRWGAARGRRGL